MEKYKDKHGTTRVGDFLRDIDLGASLKVVGNLAQGNIDGAIDVITGNETMTEEEEHLLYKLGYTRNERCI